MKRFILIIFIIFQFAGFSQSMENQSFQWNSTTEDIKIQPELKVFPNPCTGQKLTIEISNEELTELRISNIAGKVVTFKKFLTPVTKVDINLNDTPNGIYLIQIKTTANKLIAKKLVVSGR